MLDPPEPIPPVGDRSPAPAIDEIPVARAADWTPSDSPDTDPMLLARSSCGAAWVDVLTFVGLIIGCEMAIGAILGAILGINPETQTDVQIKRQLLLPLIAVRLVSTTLVIGLLLSARRQSPRSLGLTIEALPVNAAIGLGAVVVSFLLIWIAFTMLWLFWPDVVRQMAENTERLRELVPPLSPAASAAFTLAIGTYEELIFRGFLMTRLRRATGSWIVAVLIETTVFTALHAADQTPAALILVTILGLVCALVTIWRRSLVPAIVGHTLFNFVQFLYLYDQLGDTWK